MEWNELCKNITRIRNEFEKSHKCLSQNRPILGPTTKKHANILVNSFNEARILVYDNKERLNPDHWSQVSKVLIKLRSNLLSVKLKLGLDISIPTILNSPIKIESDEQTETEIEDEDLNNLTIPAILTLAELTEEELAESDIEETETKSVIMVDEAAAQRAYIKDISTAIPEFDGKKINLRRFITAIKLVNLTKGPHEAIAIEVIKSKIIGTTLYRVQNEVTIDAIIRKLEEVVVGETTDVVRAKMANVYQKGKTATQFTNEIENLRKSLESSYIDEGLQPEHAIKFSTKEAINTMTKNCDHGKLKTILEAGTFKTMDEAISKYIHCSTEMTGSASSVLFYKRGQGSYTRGNYRGRGNGRGGNNRNNYNQNTGQYNNFNNYNNSNGRGRGGYREYNYQNRGGGNYNNQNRNFSSYSQNGNVRHAQGTSENQQAPLGHQEQ